MVGMFKKTGVKLQLLADENTFLMYEKEIRGGGGGGGVKKVTGGNAY